MGRAFAGLLIGSATTAALLYLAADVRTQEIGTSSEDD